MSRRPSVNVLVLSAAFLIGAGPYLVRAAGIQAATGVVANVDMQRVFLESDARKAAETRVREYGRALFQRFGETAQLAYLTADEIAEYSEIVNAEQPTAAQQQRLAAIKAESAKRTDEAQRLALIKDSDLTAKDRARLRELNTIKEQQKPALDRLRQLYQQMVNEEDLRQTRVAHGEVRAIVGRVAKEMGCSEVFDTSSLVYATVDITQNVLPKVKKAK